MSKGKKPKTPAPVPVPTRDEALERQQEEDVMRRRKGRASTFVTRGLGVVGNSVLGVK